MIKALKALFEVPVHESEESTEQRMRLAAAALLIETARADFIQDEAEEAVLENLLCNVLHVEHSQLKDLFELATQRVDEATSLYEFTREINDHYSHAQKLRVIEAMWAVAYADGNLDKYEEALIRQVADLTYVSHEDYIRAKLTAKPIS